jgi:hypothetical protein
MLSKYLSNHITNKNKGHNNNNKKNDTINKNKIVKQKTAKYSKTPYH